MCVKRGINQNQEKKIVRTSGSQKPLIEIGKQK